MDPDSADSPIPPSKPSRPEPANSTVPEKVSSPSDSSSFLSPSAISAWAKGLKLTQPLAPANDNSSTENAVKSAFSRLTSGFGVSSPSKNPGSDGSTVGNPSAPQSSVFESFTKGVVDTSMGAVKAVQVKARHIVSQNKRRYQEGGFDLDMTYITENIIAMGFPAGDKSSGFFSFVEGFYRNHMEEVIKFFETHHKGKYKVYNLCSERLYDAALFEGKVASFPFDDHNCPPINLIKLFCQSAYSWLKEDILNVVVVHCKAGKARTGLMICSLLLFLKFFPTAEECIDYYNQRRCVDGKGLILPSQIRYVKYFERIQMQFNGETPPGRRCMLRGFRLHKCPYWVRPSITISNHNGVLFTTKKHPKTKDLMPEDFWLRSAKKGIVIFALPGEPGLTELVGDFKIHFHDRQGDFYCWLNTTMMENRSILNGSDLDGFDKRKLPSPGFQVEIVMIDYNGIVTQKFKNTDDATTSNNPPPPHHHDESSNPSSSTDKPNINHQDQQQPPLPIPSKPDDNENVFSDSDGEEEEEDTETETTQQKNTMVHESRSSTTATTTTGLAHQTEQLSLNANRESSSSSSVVPVTTAAGGVDSGKSVKEMELSSTSSSSIPNLASGDIKAIAADASVFSFGDDDDEDYESE